MSKKNRANRRSRRKNSWGSDLSLHQLIESELQSTSLEIAEKSAAVRAFVQKSNPLELLLHAMWYVRTVFFLKLIVEDLPEGKDLSVTGRDTSEAILLLEYTQSLIVSHELSAGGADAQAKTGEGELELYFSNVESLIDAHRVFKVLKYAPSTSEFSVEKQPFESIQLEEKQYLEVRGKRYTILEEEFHERLLFPQSSLLEKVFGITARDVVKGLMDISDSCIKGWSEATSDMAELFDATGSDGEGLSESNELAMRELAGKVFGADAFDVSMITSWPNALIEALSLDAGGNPDYGPCASFSGDPTSVLPIAFKPFVKIGGRHYCFSYINLLDNFYRALYKACVGNVQKKVESGDLELSLGSFEAQWKDNQQLASENAAVSILGDIMPGAVSYRNGFYPKEGLVPKKNNLVECDAIVQYDDCLFIVEVKAGSFSPSDPIDDPEGHRRSFKNLIENSAAQGNRTLDYLTRANRSVVDFYDENRGSLFSIDMSRISECFVLGVVVENVGDFSARAEKLGFLDVPSGTVVLSLNDLLAYRQYFDNPLEFIYYMIRRREATYCARLSLNDELDHLGLFIEANDYAEYVEGLADEDSIIWFDGLREELDDWFESLYRKDGLVGKPKQPSNPIYDSIIDYLSREPIQHKRAVSSALLSLPFEERDKLAAAIGGRLWRPCAPNGAIALLADKGKFHTPVSLFVETPLTINDLNICRDKTSALVLERNEEARLLIALTYDGNKRLSRCHVEVIKLAEIPQSDAARLTAIANESREERSEAMLSYLGRKVGRNELCPCGSGKKFKKCCGR